MSMAPVSEQKVTTLHKFFAKSKKVPDTQKTTPPQNNENSDSEFEMVHKKRSSTKKRENDSTVKIETPSSGESENNELRLFDSRTEGIGVPQIVATHSASSSSDSSDDNSMRNTPGTSSQHSKTAENLPLPGSPAKKIDTSEISKHVNLSSTHDISAESESDSSDSSDNSPDSVVNRSIHINLHKGDVRSSLGNSPSKSRYSDKKRKSNHSLSDEDIIPGTQQDEPIAIIKFDLKPTRNSTVKSSVFKNDLTPKALNSKSSLNSEEELKVLETSSDTKYQPYIEKVKNMMEPLNEIENDNNYSESTLHIGDVSEEEEVFLVQCPKEIDPSLLIEKVLSLDEMSSVLINNNGQSTLYDSALVKNKSQERHIDLLLPSEDHTQLKLGRYPLGGYIILSKSIEVPKLQKPKLSPTKRVQYPEPLKKLCLSLPDADSPTDPSCLNHYYRCKKAKKASVKLKEEHETDIKPTPPAFGSPEDIPETSRKRKRSSGFLSEAILETSTVRVEDPVAPVHIKKKRKHQESDSNTGKYEEGIQIKVEPEDSYEEQNTPGMKKKKKKKERNKEGDTVTKEFLGDSICIKTEPIDTSEETDTPPVKKKKRKSKISDL